MKVLALAPSASDYRAALEAVGGPMTDAPLPVGCEIVEIVEEVSGGCVCCTVRRDIEDVLADEALNTPPSFDLVVVDTTAKCVPYSSPPLPWSCCSF